MVKVEELMDKLQDHFSKILIPGQALSLDETLLWAFGYIHFKVQIINKAARYGIKLYVLTDAVTAYVLRIIPYTGRYQQYESDATTQKKTVSIVKELVANYAGSHRTIYLDRYYASMDVATELLKMQLYVTGTVMSNRIPGILTMNQKSAVYKKCHTVIL